MNEEIKTEALAGINQLISYIETGAKQAGDFVVEQTPILVQEILTYNFLENLVYLSFIWGILGIITYFTFFQKYKFEYNDGGGKKYRRNKLWTEVFEDGSEGAFCVGMGCSTPFILSGFVALININLILECFKIHFAPRLYLIEYVSELIK